MRLFPALARSGMHSTMQRVHASTVICVYFKTELDSFRLALVLESNVICPWTEGPETIKEHNSLVLVDL